VELVAVMHGQWPSLDGNLCHFGEDEEEEERVIVPICSIALFLILEYPTGRWRLPSPFTRMD
jgi:hypothetical protein